MSGILTAIPNLTTPIPLKRILNAFKSVISPKQRLNQETPLPFVNPIEPATSRRPAGYRARALAFFRSFKFLRSILLTLTLASSAFLISPSVTHAGVIINRPFQAGLNYGLVGCWNFDGSYTKAPDCSGNNNTGTLTGGPTKTQGKIGQALDFDGVDDYVAVPYSSSIAPSNITLSYWMKESSEPSSLDTLVSRKYDGLGIP